MSKRLAHEARAMLKDDVHHVVEIRRLVHAAELDLLHRLAHAGFDQTELDRCRRLAEQLTQIAAHAANLNPRFTAALERIDPTTGSLKSRNRKAARHA